MAFEEWYDMAESSCITGAAKAGTCLLMTFMINAAYLLS